MTKRELARAISQAQSKGLAYATIDVAYRSSAGTKHVPALEVAGILFGDYQRWLVWLTWDTSSDAEALASGEY